MKTLLASIVVLTMTGCSKKEPAASADRPAAVTPEKVAPRPAAATDELVNMYEVYATSYDKIMRDIASAGSDCELAAANVKRDVASLDMPTAEQLLAQMDGKPHEVEVWVAETYGARFKESAMRVAPMEQACSSNASLRAAMTEAMSKFPMMRKKHG